MEGCLGQFHRDLIWQDTKSTGEKRVGEMPVKAATTWDIRETETELNGWNGFEAKTAKKAATKLKDLSL